MVPAALEIAMEEDVEFRRGLPLDYLTYMGIQNSDKVISQLFRVYSSLPVNIPILGFSPITQNEQSPPCMYRMTRAGQNSSHKLRF